MSQTTRTDYRHALYRDFSFRCSSCPDTVIVHSMDRLARNLEDLRRIVRDLTAKGVRVQFLTEQLTFTGDDTAMARLLLSVMGAFAEFSNVP
jgi:DNA invertase Pin-like site-specific DNA recombinase